MEGRNLWRWSVVGMVALSGTLGWLIASSPASAEATAAASPCCVGVLRLNDVLSKLDEKSVRETELKKFFDEREKAVNALLDRVKTLREELKLLPKDSPDRNAKREEYARVGAQAKIEADLSQVLAAEKKKLMELDMFNKIKDAAATVAQRQGLSLVLNDDSQVEIPDDAEYRDVQNAMINRRVLFAADTVDISAEVANYMNNEFKAKGP